MTDEQKQQRLALIKQRHKVYLGRRRSIEFVLRQAGEMPDNDVDDLPDWGGEAVEA
jgi:hypothetical protein